MSCWHCRALQLAPQCQQDIDGYRAELWTDVVHLRVVAAEVVPGGGVLVLRVTGNRANKHILCLVQHVVARAGLRGGRLEIDDGGIDAKESGLDVAGRLRRHPSPRLRAEG